jgi:dolichol-phosphate mannosyltransferase
LGVFCLFSITHKVKLNWTGPIWLAVLPCIAATLILLSHSPRSFLRSAWAVTVGVLFATYSLFLTYLTRGLPGIRYAKNIEILPVGWSEMGRALEEKKTALKAEHDREVFVVGLDRNFIASEAAFYHSDHPESIAHTTGSHLFGGRALMYEFWFPHRIPDGSDMLLVSFEKSKLNKRAIRDRCRALRNIEETWLIRDGKRIRRFYTRAAFGYRPTPSGV